MKIIYNIKNKKTTKGNKMKKILLILGVFLLPSLLFAEASSLSSQLQEESKGLMTVIWWGLKLSGFAVLIWGISDLMAEEQGQGSGGKYIKAVVKIVVGAIFMGAEKIYNKL